jgi:putative transposase
LTDSRNARDDHFLNLLRDVDIKEPFQALSSDISYIPTAEGFEYTCIIRDILSGVVLSEHTAARMTKELVMETIRSASKQWHLPKGAIFHSDRGSQYTSAAVMEQLRKLGLKQSFSRVGMPGDNAWSESFFSILKKELVHPLGRFQIREQARQAVFAYINGFYNTKRIQKRLGYLSPLQWLTQWNSRNLVLTA